MKRWFSARAMWLHVTAAAVVAICITAGVWQLRRASGGNTLSWAYAIQWPAFAVIAVIVWWRLLHDDFKLAPRDDEEAAIAAEPALPERRRDEEDEELRAYNDYLAELAATHQRKTWRSGDE